MPLRFERPAPNIKDPKDLLRRLKAALKADGDFPVRARVVSELYSLANNENTNVNRIADLILKEPSLGTRVIHMVNSAYYHRGRNVLTVSQAVLQIGMRTLCDICAGFVLIHKFIPAAKRGGIFADNIKRSILTSLLTSSLAGLKNEAGIAEKGYLAGTFFNLGHLLLAYYFPQVYEAAAKRAALRGHDTNQSITELLGISPADLNLVIVESLDIPQYYKDLLLAVAKPKDEPPDDPVMLTLIQALSVGSRMAEVIVAGQNREQLERLLAEQSRSSIYSLTQLREIIADLPDAFSQHCEMVELGFLKLPEFVVEFANEMTSQ